MTDTELKQKLGKSLEVLSGELRSLRVGRATADMVEHIMVEAYDSVVPLTQVASVTVPQRDQIVIQPWDAQVLDAIMASLRKSDLQMNPVVDSNVIRITMPPLTEERRIETVKLLGKLAENARIALRNIRDEAMKDIDSHQMAKELSEDAARSAKEGVQKQIDEHNAKIKDMTQKKEQEIMQI